LPAADPADVDLLVDAAREAGRLVMGYWRRDPKVWHKAESSPVTEADIAADDFLKERLLGARPSYAWLSEETADDPARLGAARVFVVDPIDGTRGFIAGGDEWVVSVALLVDDRPAAGVLYRPVTGELYRAVAGQGATLDGMPLRVREEDPSRALRVAGSSAMLRRAKAAGVEFARTGFIASLALRIAMVASGRIDLALANPAAYDWDVAAADLILGEAGGALTDVHGRPLEYNRALPRHPALIAAAPRLGRVAASWLDAEAGAAPGGGRGGAP